MPTAAEDAEGLCGAGDSYPPGLLTDLYQLTMACGYRRAGVADTEACFHVAFRSNPYGGGYAVFCGLEQAVDYLRGLSFPAGDLAYLSGLPGNDGRPLFDDDFLEWLRGFRFECDVDSVPEGTVVFANEPTVRVSGPIAQAQVVETTLLNILNFQTLVATKAARVCHSAAGDPVIEFGLRRAQGPDGALSASRAAYVGGCASTSDLLAGRRYGIPVGGTHAHSWIMAFPSERDAFEAWARVMPNNCTFLVDTYDTLEGVRNAAAVGLAMRERGQRMIGIRIDSGDLARLSVEARRILDEAGLPDAVIVASNELDEYLVESLKEQGAAIDVWGVGTRLATGDGQGALGGVYKLSAIRRPGEEWSPRVKVSEQTMKVTTPGLLGVRRFFGPSGSPAGDVVYDVRRPPEGEWVMVDPLDPTMRRSFGGGEPHTDLMRPVLRRGEPVWDRPALTDVREHARAGLASLDPALKRFLNPAAFPVGLERGVHAERTRLILEARGLGERAAGE